MRKLSPRHPQKSGKITPGCNQEKLQSLMKQGGDPLIKTKAQTQQNKTKAQAGSERGPDTEPYESQCAVMGQSENPEPLVEEHQIASILEAQRLKIGPGSLCYLKCL